MTPFDFRDEVGRAVRSYFSPLTFLVRGIGSHFKSVDEDDIVYRLRKRAEIRRQIPGRKSVQEGKSDRLADLLEEAADEIEMLRL